jgi:hypothetical protein
VQRHPHDPGDDREHKQRNEPRSCRASGAFVLGQPVGKLVTSTPGFNVLRRLRKSSKSAIDSEATTLPASYLIVLPPSVP